MHIGPLLGPSAMPRREVPAAAAPVVAVWCSVNCRGFICCQIVRLCGTHPNLSSSCLGKCCACPLQQLVQATSCRMAMATKQTQLNAWGHQPPKRAGDPAQWASEHCCIFVGCCHMAECTCDAFLKTGTPTHDNAKLVCGLRVTTG